MKAMNRKPLRWFPLWRLLGWCFVSWVVYQSLTPTPIPPPDFDYGDKVGHFSAYFVMMAWFAQLYVRRQHAGYMVGFIVLGIVMEVLQGQTPSRLFEYADMAANTLGAVTAWWLVRGGLSMWLLQAEQFYLSNRN